MDWNRCIICQKITAKSLECPANSKRNDAGAGYLSFIRNVEEFEKLGINVLGNGSQVLADEGKGLEQTVRQQSFVA